MKRTKRSMPAEHKAAVAAGQAQRRIVRRYLDALEGTEPRPGRARTHESINRRMAVIEAELPTADPLSRVQLMQQRMALIDERAALDTKTELANLEAAFAAVAKAYSTRTGVSYQAWREAGVAIAVLRRAGINRRDQ